MKRGIIIAAVLALLAPAAAQAGETWGTCPWRMPQVNFQTSSPSEWTIQANWTEPWSGWGPGGANTNSRTNTAVLKTFALASGEYSGITQTVHIEPLYIEGREPQEWQHPVRVSLKTVAPAAKPFTAGEWEQRLYVAPLPEELHVEPCWAYEQTNYVTVR